MAEKNERLLEITKLYLCNIKMMTLEDHFGKILSVKNHFVKIILKKVQA